MIFFSKEMQSQIKNKTATKEDLTNYLLTNLTVMELAEELADYIPPCSASRGKEWLTGVMSLKLVEDDL